RPPPMVVEAALPGVRLEYRRDRLLGLQEQRIVVVAPQQEDDPVPGADAPDADDLASGFDEVIVGEEMVAIGVERLAVGGETAGPLALDVAPLGELRDRGYQRRVADEPQLTVLAPGELAEGAEAVLVLGLGDQLLGPAALGALQRRLELRQLRLDVEP